MNVAKSILIIGHCVALTVFVACSKSERAPSPISRNSDVRPQPDQGTGDGGGGNTCNGRPLESYAFDVTATSAFKKHIQPLYNDLKEHNNDIFRLINSVVKGKNWYLIDCELTRLPDSKIGSAAKTEQGAIQTFTEVWNSKDIVGSMSDADQANLFMHEIFMGLRLLKFESSFNQCMAFAPSPDLCEGLSKVKKGKASDLTTEDYARIRYAAIEIFKLPRPIAPEAWEDFLAKTGFTLDSRRFERIGENEQLNFTEVANRLNTAQLSGYLPKVGHTRDASGKVKYGKCGVTFAADKTKNRIEVSVQTDGRQLLKSTFTISGTVPTWRANEFGREFVNLTLSPHEEPGFRLGERKLQMKFTFEDKASVYALSINEVVCVEEQTIDGVTSCSRTRSHAESMDYVCAQDKLTAEQL